MFLSSWTSRKNWDLVKAFSVVSRKSKTGWPTYSQKQYDVDPFLNIPWLSMWNERPQKPKAKFCGEFPAWCHLLHVNLRIFVMLYDHNMIAIKHTWINQNPWVRDAYARNTADKTSTKNFLKVHVSWVLSHVVFVQDQDEESVKILFMITCRTW